MVRVDQRPQLIEAYVTLLVHSDPEHIQAARCAPDDSPVG